MNNPKQWTTLADYIQRKLERFSGEGKLLTEVLPYHDVSHIGYPYATFEPTESAGSYHTNAQNLRVYSFDINIHQTLGKKTAIADLLDITDEIIQAFDEDYTLGGNCDFTSAVNQEWQIYEGKAGLVRVATLRIDCSVAIMIM